MQVVHYTKSRDWKLKPIQITNPGDGRSIFIKPIGGLWCSPIDSDYGWKEWCEAEEYGDLSTKCRIILDIDMSNFVTIDRESDALNKLFWQEVLELPDIYSIDFKGMKCSGIDGIFLTEEGQYKTRFMLPYSKSLYGWDCESLVILNERCINNYYKESQSSGAAN